jgi:hypothetical protein
MLPGGNEVEALRLSTLVAEIAPAPLTNGEEMSAKLDNELVTTPHCKWQRPARDKPDASGARDRARINLDAVNDGG